jgi:hypothetical protein
MNEQTVINNYYQKCLTDYLKTVNTKTQEEFDTFVIKLRAAGVQVTVIDDTLDPDTPMSFFK